MTSNYCSRQEEFHAASILAMDNNQMSLCVQRCPTIAKIWKLEYEKHKLIEKKVFPLR